MSQTQDVLSLEPIVAAAERILSKALGGPVRLESDADLGGSNRSNVLRCTVVDGPSEAAPGSVIVKRVQRDAEHPYDPDDGAAWSPACRLFNDWAGARFLSAVSGASPQSPTLYGGDRDLGLIVLEDIGEGESLADVLLGTDAECAETALVALAATLGRMHTATIGHADAYRRMRRELGPYEEDDGVREGQEGSLEWKQAAEETLSLTLPAGFDAEIRSAQAAMRAPGPFLAYTHGDPCPDNNRYGEGRIRLFDFETGGFRHALLDGVYGRILFPTCWCVNRLPPHIPPRMEEVYRTELARGCPQVSDDTLFGQAVTSACAVWVMRTMRWIMPRMLTEDGEWGISTVRQRVLVRLDIFAATTEEFGYLEGMGATARQMAARLRSLWPAEADQMPLYPAFRPEEIANHSATN